MTTHASDLGEFGLIERLLRRLGAGGEGVEVGPGDDAAVVRIGGSKALVTADLLLEGVHFEIGLSTPSDVGWKALAVNISDIAAMGGLPRYGLVSLGAPAATPAATLEQLYDGLVECAATFGVSVVGGDTVRADRLIISVAVLGEAGPAGPVTRAGASPGEAVVVSGPVGGAAAGLALLRAVPDDRHAAMLLERFPSLPAAHRRPRPQVGEGVAAAKAGATAMIDLSDGLGQDLGHVCSSSGVGVTLAASAIPLAEGVAETTAWAGRDPLELGVGGGEDYELAIVIPERRIEKLLSSLGPGAARIGSIIAGDRVQLDSGSGELEDASPGWDHFREES